MPTANGPDDIFVERPGKIYAVDARFTSDAHLRRGIAIPAVS